MSDAEITIGGAEVYASGSVLCQNNAPIRLRPFGSNTVYFLELRFVVDGSESNLTWYPENGGFVVELRNTHSLDGNITPIYVANHNGRKILLNLAVQTVGNHNFLRVVVYTLFDGGALA